MIKPKRYRSAYIMVDSFHGLIISRLPPDPPPVPITKSVIGYKATNYRSSSIHLDAKDIKFSNSHIG